MITGSLLFIACLNGTFGLNCQYNCSGNCLDEETCNSTDGTCTSCSPGWDSVWCNTSKTDLKRLVLISIAENWKKNILVGSVMEMSPFYVWLRTVFLTYKKFDYSNNLNGQIMLLWRS